MANMYGELIRAQLHNSASDLSPTATGLIYHNTGSSKPKIYTGAAWKEFLLEGDAAAVEKTMDSAAGSTGVTLGTADEDVHIFSPTAGITVKLDNTYSKGRIIRIFNSGTGSDDIITLTANNDATIRKIYPETMAEIICNTDTPTTSSHWTGVNKVVSGSLAVTVTSTWNNDTITCYRKRDGETAKYRLKLSLSGAHGGANLVFTIPDTIDSAKVHNTANNREPIGIWTAYDGGSVQPCGYLTMVSTTTIIAMRFTDSSTTQSLTAEDGSVVTLNSGDEIYANFEVPISGWGEFSG